MNDFTKEELILAHELIDACIELAREPDCVYDLRDKIQSMIDSYYSQSIDVWHCEKCGHLQ